jgi:hypothetical protein
MITKTFLKEHLETLPEEFSLDELISQLILIEKIETGLSQSEKNEVLNEDELDQELKSWFN